MVAQKLFHVVSLQPFSAVRPFTFIIMKNLPKLGPVKLNSVLVSLGNSTVRGVVSNVGGRKLLRLTGNNINTKLLNYKVGNTDIFKLF
jgi:hypothetical protein